MGKNILFISIDGMTDPLGQSQVIPYLAGLAARGSGITIISCEKKENFSKNEKAVNAILKKAGINWKYCFYSKKIPLLSQRGNLQNLKKLAAQEAEKSKEPVIAHCRSYLPALVGLHLKKRYKAKLLFDMRGFWADERTEGGIWKLKNPLHKRAYSYFKKKEKELVTVADHIVTLTGNAVPIVEQWQGSQKRPISVIPCCADTHHFIIQPAAERSGTRKKLGIAQDTFVLGYLGSIGTWYMLDEMLDFFYELKQRKKNAAFLFITPDDKEHILKAAAQKNIPATDIVIRSATRNEVPSYISVFNAGVFFIRSSFSKKGSSPTKLAELLACGIPVITNAGVGDCDTIIKRNNCGLIIDNFTGEDYNKAIDNLDTLVNMPSDLLRKTALDNFSLEKGVDEYEKIYRSLCR